MKFSELGLCPELLAGIEKLGFEETTPVQSEVIPFLLDQTDDLVALAQTGTGKTGAFGWPILEKIDKDSRRTQALILCPTRELCMQITRDLQSYAISIPSIKVLAIYGGTDIRSQLMTLKRGVQIVVATPGRMVDVLRRDGADLSEVTRVVLDEADEMLTMGFEEDLKTILSDVPKAAQRLLFSATMPKDVERMANDYMDSAHEITIGSRNTATSLVKHELVVVHSKHRYNALRRLVDTSPGIYGIIFCRTRMETKMVADRLSKDGYAAEALNGDLLQDERDHVMKKFRDHRLQLLVATDVAARGLDINDLTHVIHYAIPDDFNTYTHRSGRTGRAGKTGTSIAIIHNREQFKIERFEKVLGQKLELRPVPTGHEVSRQCLINMAEQVRDVQNDNSLLDKYLEEMYSVLDGLSKEEVIQRFALLQNHKMLQHYHDTPDLSTEPEKMKTKPKNEERVSGKDAREAHVPRKMTAGMIELVINIGERNELTLPKLKEILNSAIPGAPIKIGRVNIVEMQSYFEVMFTESTDIINHFANQSVEYDGRKLNVALAGNATIAKSKAKTPSRKDLKFRNSSRN